MPVGWRRVALLDEALRPAAVVRVAQLPDEVGFVDAPRLWELPAVPDDDVRRVHLTVQGAVFEEADAVGEGEDRATPHAHVCGKFSDVRGTRGEQAVIQNNLCDRSLSQVGAADKA